MNFNNDIFIDIEIPAVMENDVFHYDYVPAPRRPRAWNPNEFADVGKIASTHFVPSGTLIDKMKKSIASRFEMYGIEQKTWEKSTECFGFEVGDDRVDISDSPVPLAAMLFAQEEIFKMKTSEEDTFISKQYWNFCEVTSIVPCHPLQNLEFAKKTEFKDVGYIDSVTMRLTVDVQKADRSHSSTGVGKSGMMASRSANTRPESYVRMNLASFVQDSTLRTTYIPDPKYLPRLMGGTGHKPLWSNPVNTFLYVKAYKRGTYDRVYGSAANEIVGSLASLDTGGIPTVVLCKMLRDKQNYLHGTYADKVLVDVRKKIEVEPIFLRLPAEAGLYGVETRLYQAREILQEKQALTELLRTNRITQALFCFEGVREFERLERVSNTERREEYELALQGNSAFQRLLARKGNDHDVTDLIRKGFLSIGGAVTSYTMELNSMICKGNLGGAYVIDDIPVTEDCYLMDDVSMEATMRVGSIPLKTIFSRKSTKIVLTEARLGLWQVSESQETWAKNIVEELRNARAVLGRPLAYSESRPILTKNMEWVRDDTFLISDAIRLTAGKAIMTLLFFTDDQRLVKQAAKSTGHYVLQVSPRTVITSNGVTEAYSTENVNQICLRFVERWKKVLQSYMPKIYEWPFVDTGSFKSSAMKVELIETVKEGRRYYSQQIVFAGPTSEGRQAVVRYKQFNEIQRQIVLLHSPADSTRSITLRGEETPNQSRFQGLTSSVRQRRNKG